MATEKIFVVTDLGPGDGGKGGVVHKICEATRAHTVIKVGGAQGSHGVRTSRGESFNFSHFGCGTFEGVRTHITKNMVMDPGALIAEEEMLRYGCSFRGAFDRLTIDENALCNTPYHRVASRLRELARKNVPRGTIGTGVGEAHQDASRRPDQAIRAKDLGSRDLRDRLEAVRRQKLDDLKAIIECIGGLWADDVETALENVAFLRNPRTAAVLAKEWASLADRIKVVDGDHLRTGVLSRDGTAVVESSHGVLTDNLYGFHPHVSKLRTLPKFTLDLLAEQEYGGRVVRLGVTRAYAIRHGAGPMVTADASLDEFLLPGSSKEENRWQGRVRVGALDFVALRYAINVCGGAAAFDGLAITWFDQVQAFGSWPVCDRYTDTGNPRFFDENREIRVYGEDGDMRDYQERLGKILNGCRPYVEKLDIPADADQVALARFCGEVVERKLGVPARMVSLGPTEDDKVLL